MSLCVATAWAEAGEDAGSQGVGRQEQAEGESSREIEDRGGGEPSLGWDHLRRRLRWEIMWADKAVLEGGQGHRGSPASRE